MSDSIRNPRIWGFLWQVILGFHFGTLGFQTHYESVTELDSLLFVTLRLSMLDSFSEELDDSFRLIGMLYICEISLLKGFYQLID